MKFLAVLRPTIQKVTAHTCMNPLSSQVVIIPLYIYFQYN